jgi:hypothetical protein
MIATYNKWTEENAGLPAGTAIQGDSDAAAGAHPLLGLFDYEFRGLQVRRQVFSDALYHFQRVLDVVAGLDSEGRARFEKVVSRTGGEAVLSAHLKRRIKSEGYRFVLE